jgi:hypothetical protein
MRLRFACFPAVVGLLAVITLFLARWPGIEPAQTASFRPVKILLFYATVGTLTQGDKALLCYGVENARSVHISPLFEPLAPATNRCLEIVPQHTTHYTILAEGFDGRVVTQSVTLPVNAAPLRPRTIFYFALLHIGR